MPNIYKITKEDYTRYYKHLKSLCDCEGLDYSKVHYHVLRKGKGYWFGDYVEVEEIELH